ncbi:hypothetical protein GLW08_03940 [Pontibacillus yanchengensis]|uniref:Uncharacterized protein n=2 Tax=Pontibacillus yanchengensis TaxID=462910 RepID=A0ACC7VE57_9BACI|nr:hypothetical protein [Pontibacillus yanchengensis]MYL35147.1 hypothetical protein [Pontibacillus yanchengensis]MYL52486.1 hypothetical protein [Pontibacillus yanchengensis]
MSHAFKVMMSVLLLCIVFLGGYIVGDKQTNTVTRKVMVGYDKEGVQRQIDFDKVITDKQSQKTVDQLMQLLMYSSQMKNVTINRKEPDVYLMINSSERGISLVRSELWFNERETIIKMEEGDYRILNPSQTEKLKKLIDYSSR